MSNERKNEKLLDSFNSLSEKLDNWLLTNPVMFKLGKRKEVDSLHRERELIEKCRECLYKSSLKSGIEVIISQHQTSLEKDNLFSLAIKIVAYADRTSEQEKQLITSVRQLNIG